MSAIVENGCFTDCIRADLHDYCGASNLAFNEYIHKLQDSGKTVYHFGFGQAPFPVPECAVEALRKYAAEKAYLPVAGLTSLRKAIVDFHTTYDGLRSIHADQVLVGPGTKELIFLALQVFNGDVMVISPTWTTYKPQCLLAGKRPITITTTLENDWRITPEMVEKAVVECDSTANKILIFCNPDNPTGTVYKAEHLKQLSEVFRKHKIIVLCDEIYSRLNYSGDHVTLAKFYPEGTILSCGLSKWASAGGWRLGYHIYPDSLTALREAVKSAASHTYTCASAPVQYAATELLKNSEVVDEYIKHTARIMSAVAGYCHSELTSVGVKAVKPCGGYYIFPDWSVVRSALSKRGITTGEQMCTAILAEANVALMSGGPAFLRPDTELTTRLCFVNFDGTEALKESRRIGLDKPLPERFVKVYATPVHEGIQALKDWVVKQLNSQ